jgi:AraC family ethanolamine operon transcriptional activator
LTVCQVSGQAFSSTIKQGRLINAVRKQLRSGTVQKVVDATNAWVWHMGQFAADYRKLFGELPSETLNKTS